MLKHDAEIIIDAIRDIATVIIDGMTKFFKLKEENDEKRLRHIDYRLDKLEQLIASKLQPQEVVGNG